MRFSPILTSLLLLVCLPFSAVSGKLYKWVDEQGRAHYSDRLPPQDTTRAHNYIDERGITLESVDAAKTPEQILQEAEVERLRRERQALIDKQVAQDRVLLRTFRTEDDIIMTRDGQIQTVDAFIKVTRANIKRIKLKLEEMQREAAARELSGQRISVILQEEIDAKNLVLEEAYQSIVNREHDKDRIRRSFANDLKRFRELRQLEEVDDPLEEASVTFVEALKNVYDCGDDNLCDLAWNRARDYVKRYNTTPIKMNVDNIFLSGSPVKEDDISITLSRIQDSKRGRTLIFMDLQCKDTPQGNRHCQSDQVEAIKQGFQDAVSR